MDKEFIYDIFDDYQNGELSEMERQDVEKRLAEDSEFAEEFELYQLMVGGIKTHGKATLQNKIQAVEDNLAQNNFFSQSTKIVRLENREVSHTRIYAIAASVLIIITAGVFLFKKPSESFDSSEAFAQLHKAESKNVVKIIDELSAPGLAGNKNAKDSLAIAMTLFKDAKYQESRTAFTEYLKKYPQDNIAKLYLGLSLFEIKEYPIAVTQLNELADKTDFEYSNTAKWYLVLAYTQVKNKASYEDAKKLLNQLAQDSESGYTEEAKTYLRLMK